MNGKSKELLLLLNVYIITDHNNNNKTAACDLSVTSPLNSKILSEAGVTAGAAAHATELRKHEANDAKYNDLGWVCIPLVVESYRARGKKALEAFSMLTSRLAMSSSWPKSMVLSELHGRLNLHLVRANVRAFCADFPAIIRNTFEFVCCFVTCVWLLLHLCSLCK